MGGDAEIRCCETASLPGSWPAIVKPARSLSTNRVVAARIARKVEALEVSVSVTTTA